MIDDALLNMRELHSGDLDRVAEIEDMSNASPWSRSLFAGELDLGPTERLWLVGELDDYAHEPEVVGFAGAMFVGDDVHLMNVAVDNRHRRRGFGEALVAELLARSVEAGARNATLEVRAGNAGAVALYRRFRFAPVGARRGYYPDGEDAFILWVHDIHESEYRQRLYRLAEGDRRG